MPINLGAYFPSLKLIATRGYHKNTLGFGVVFDITSRSCDLRIRHTTNCDQIVTSLHG